MKRREDNNRLSNGKLENVCAVFG